jgi:hypothetical protein
MEGNEKVTPEKKSPKFQMRRHLQRHSQDAEVVRSGVLLQDSMEGSKI